MVVVCKVVYTVSKVAYRKYHFIKLHAYCGLQFYTTAIVVVLTVVLYRVRMSSDMNIISFSK